MQDVRLISQFAKAAAPAKAEATPACGPNFATALLWCSSWYSMTSTAAHAQSGAVRPQAAVLANAIVRMQLLSLVTRGYPVDQQTCMVRNMCAA